MTEFTFQVAIRIELTVLANSITRMPKSGPSAAARGQTCSPVARPLTTCSAGPDRLLGGGGNDLLRGALGNDLLRGGPGVDSPHGGPGRDRVEDGR